MKQLRQGGSNRKAEADRQDGLSAKFQIFFMLNKLLLLLYSLLSEVYLVHFVVQEC